MPPWLARWPVLGDSRLAPLSLAALVVVLIAVLGAIGTYYQKYLSTAAGQHVMYDLRHTLYSGSESRSPVP